MAQQVDEKKTSIIIPCYNIAQEQVDIAQRCFKNIKRFTQLPYELIVIDNASTIGREFLEEAAHVYFRNKENLGCAKSWNQGIGVASGYYICIMNNDLLIFEGWLEGLIETIESDEKFGIVGPDVVQYLGHTNIDEAEEKAKELWKDNYFEFTDRGDGYGALFLARRSLYDELGPFDENFEIGMFEDRDLWVRAHDAGYKIIRTQKTWCFHIGNMTWGKIENNQQIYLRNKEYYETKHGLESPVQGKTQPEIKRQKKIAIITLFSTLEPTYSLTGIVKDQLDVLTEHGYDTTLIVLENFKDDCEETYQINKCLPVHTWTDYQLDVEKQSDFDQQVKETENALVNSLQEIDIAITHDIMFQTWFLPHNQAVRNCAKRLPKIKWFHWQHSAPSERPSDLKYPHNLRYEGMENSKYVYLNYWDIPRVAKMYNIPESEVRVVYNAKDVRSFFDLDEITVSLINKYGLLEADVLCVYPARMTSGKQPDKIIKIIAKIKEQEKNAKVVFCNSYSNAKAELEYIKSLRQLAADWGLTESEVIFTSEEGYQLGVPLRVVRELLQISNVFILPSLSEACSLILLEAAAAKNLLVLNDDFPPLREFGKQNALYFKFSSTLFKTEYHPDEQSYMGDCALAILAELNANKCLATFQEIKQRFNKDYILKNQLEPLFYEQ